MYLTLCKRHRPYFINGNKSQLSRYPYQRSVTFCNMTSLQGPYHRHVMVYGQLTCMLWWRHQMETFSAWLALCAGNSPVSSEFPAQRPMTQSFGVFFDLRLNQRLRKNNREAGDLRRHRAHYDVIVMSWFMAHWHACSTHNIVMRSVLSNL